MRFCAQCGQGFLRGPKARYCSERCKRDAYIKKSSPGPRTPRPGEKSTKGLCEVDGCERGRHARGLCGAHQHLQARYALTLEEMAALQAGAPCAICSNRATVVDHCHVSGKVRGYLCRPCNVALGGFRDRPDLLRKALAYLA